MASEIIGIGVTCIDHVSIVSRADDGWEVCGPPLVQGGGLTATAAVTAARLGASVELWTVLGDDHHGRMARRELADQGVNVEHVKLLPGARTPSAFVEVDSRTGERTIYYSPGRGLPSPEDDLGFDISRVERARALLVDRLWLRTSIAAARLGRQSGAVVVADLFELQGPVAELVSLVDALIVPDEASTALVGRRDHPLALRQMAAMGPTMPAITVGSEGCWYLADGHVYHCPAFPVEVVDTTGCGDSFHGAFAYAMTRGWDVHQAIRFSSAVAALKATKQGGRTGLPTLEQAMRFLDERHDQGRARRV